MGATSVHELHSRSSISIVNPSLFWGKTTERPKAQRELLSAGVQKAAGDGVLSLVWDFGYYAPEKL